MPLALIREIETWSALNCGYEPTTLTALLSLTRYTGPLLTLLMYAVGIRYREVFLLLFGFGLTLDGLVNTAVRYAVNDTESVVATCTDPYQPGMSPSFQMQHAAFFVVFTLSYAGAYRPRLKLWHVALLVAFYAAVLYADTALNYHTERAVLAGAYLGAFNALLWQLIVRYAFYPYFPDLLRTHVVRYFAYQDTLCGERAAYADPGHVEDVRRFRREVAPDADGSVPYAVVERFIASLRW